MSIDLKETMHSIAKILHSANLGSETKLIHIERLIDVATANQQVQELSADLDLVFNSHHNKPDYANYLTTAQKLIAKGWVKGESS